MVSCSTRLLTIIILFCWLAVASCGMDQMDAPVNDFALGETDYQLDCDPSGSHAEAYACQLAYYTNRERQGHVDESDHAASLDWSDNLADMAEAYSRRMCDEGFFDHNDPQGHGMESRFQEAGVFYVKAGENLARGKDLLPSNAMELFMNEPSCEKNHRGNVLDNDFTFTGVGTVFCGDYTIYTQLFATFDTEDLREDQNEFCGD